MNALLVFLSQHCFFMWDLCIFHHAWVSWQCSSNRLLQNVTITRSIALPMCSAWAWYGTVRMDLGSWPVKYSLGDEWKPRPWDILPLGAVSCFRHIFPGLLRQPAHAWELQQGWCSSASKCTVLVAAGASDTQEDGEVQCYLGTSLQMLLSTKKKGGWKYFLEAVFHST